MSNFWPTDLIGNGVLISLLLSSVYVWTVIIKKAITLYLELRLIKEFKEYVYTMPRLKRLIVEDSNMHFKIYDALLAYHASSHLKEEDKMKKQSAIVDNISEIYQFQLEKDLDNLSIIASIAPFIGLFGTVWGIMNSFQSIAKCNSTSISIVAPGISEALFATAVGLFVAIPASIAAHLFFSKIEQMQKDGSIFSAYIIDRLESSENARS